MGGASTLATTGVNLALSQQASRKKDKQIKKSRDEEIEAINQDVATKQGDQNAALRRRLAALKARTGASGVASKGGSIDAVIRGLERETATTNAELVTFAQNQIAGARESASSQRQRNLLSFTSSLVGSGRSSRSLLS